MPVNLKIILILLFLRTLGSDESWSETFDRGGVWLDKAFRRNIRFSHSSCVRYGISGQNKGPTFPSQ